MFNATKMHLFSSLNKTSPMKHIYVLLAGLIGLCAHSQITGKIVDANTGDPIPYANIQCNNQGLISNEEGFFRIAEAGTTDDTPILISYIGYAATQATPASLRSEMTVKLIPATFELDEVTARTPPTPEVIMATVRKNLKDNYKAGENPFQTKIFMRESSAFMPKKLLIELEKSTGFTKNNLKAFNADLAKFTSRAVSNPSKQYTDVLFNYYGLPKTATYKMDVAKATKLHDKNKSSSIEDMQGNAMDLFLKHLDTTKYYRIKSGWFGTHDTVTLRKDFVSNKKQKPKTELTSLKNNFYGVLNENSVFSKDFEFIHEPKDYTYKNEGSVLLPDGNFAYVVSFSPNRSRAIYTGKMYISENDFAIIRADYKLVEGKKAGGLNMKLLLGVKFSENLKSGTMIFNQRPGGDGYYLQYASAETGQYFYLNRPLKFIEITKEEKDVVAFDLKIEGNMYNKTEYLNLERHEIPESAFEAAKETEFKYQVISQYDPKLWADVGGIEPLQEMKRFKAEETP